MTPAGRAPVALGLMCLATGCLHDSPPPSPTMLSDGSPARPARVALAGVDGTTVVTRVRVVHSQAVEAGSAAARCLGSSGRSDGVVVERIDVRGSSVTYLGPGRHDGARLRASGQWLDGRGAVVWTGVREARGGATARSTARPQLP